MICILVCFREIQENQIKDLEETHKNMANMYNANRTKSKLSCETSTWAAAPLFHPQTTFYRWQLAFNCDTKSTGFLRQLHKSIFLYYWLEKCLMPTKPYTATHLLNISDQKRKQEAQVYSPWLNLNTYDPCGSCTRAQRACTRPSVMVASDAFGTQQIHSLRIWHIAQNVGMRKGGRHKRRV